MLEVGGSPQGLGDFLFRARFYFYLKAQKGLLEVVSKHAKNSTEMYLALQESLDVLAFPHGLGLFPPLWSVAPLQI